MSTASFSIETEIRNLFPDDEREGCRVADLFDATRAIWSKAMPGERAPTQLHLRIATLLSGIDDDTLCRNFANRFQVEFPLLLEECAEAHDLEYLGRRPGWLLLVEALRYRKTEQFEGSFGMIDEPIQSGIFEAMAPHLARLNKGQLTQLVVALGQSIRDLQTPATVSSRLGGPSAERDSPRRQQIRNVLATQRRLLGHLLLEAWKPSQQRLPVEPAALFRNSDVTRSFGECYWKGLRKRSRVQQVLEAHFGKALESEALAWIAESCSKAPKRINGQGPVADRIVELATPEDAGAAASSSEEDSSGSCVTFD